MAESTQKNTVNYENYMNYSTERYFKQMQMAYKNKSGLSVHAW